MSGLAVVVLNYNDYDNTSAQVERILGYSVVNEIIVVDNCSPDRSGVRLSRAAAHWNAAEERKGRGRRVAVLCAGRNGGYGAGNNLGLRYAARQGMRHALIANPDTRFSEALLRAMLAVFSEAERRIERGEDTAPLGAISARMQDRQHGRQQSAWPIRGFLGELLNSGPLCRRLFRPFLNYPESLFRGGKICAGQRLIEVSVLHGSLLMLNIDAFWQSGGYDERIFLYGEENILARRLRAAGFRSGLLPEQSYFHENGGSTEKSYQALLPRQRLRQRSERYYYRQYLRIGTAAELLTLLFQGVVLLETAAADLWKRSGSD